MCFWLFKIYEIYKPAPVYVWSCLHCSSHLRKTYENLFLEPIIW